MKKASKGTSPARQPQREQASAKQTEGQKAQGKKAQGKKAPSLAQPRLVDRYLPVADIIESRHILVDAPASTTYAALRRIDFARTESPLVRALLRIGLRMVQRARRELGLAPLRKPVKLTFENMESFGRILLAENAGREIVVGAIARPGDVKSALERRTPEEFLAFDCPGYVKAAASFSVTPHGPKQSILSYEARTRAIDTETRRKLFTLDLLLSPLQSLVMERVLDQVQNAAERSRRGCKEQAR